MAFHASPGSFVALLQDVALELTEPRELKWFAAYGVVGDALVGRQVFRRLLYRLMYHAVGVGTSTYLTRLRHDHCDEPAVFLQHADLTGQRVLQVGCFDGFGLDVLATEGHDQGR